MAIANGLALLVRMVRCKTRQSIELFHGVLNTPCIPAASTSQFVNDAHVPASAEQSVSGFISRHGIHSAQRHRYKHVHNCNNVLNGRHPNLAGKGSTYPSATLQRYAFWSERKYTSEKSASKEKKCASMSLAGCPALNRWESDCTVFLLPHLHQ